MPPVILPNDPRAGGWAITWAQHIRSILGTLLRIRSFAASIAAVMLTAGVLTGCTSPAPAPTDSPTASAAAPEPTPSPTAQAAPDLAALCEQLLPLETVQERFGADTTLRVASAPSAVPDLAAWGAVARGDLQCSWGDDGDTYWSSNAVLMMRGDDSEFEELRESADEYPSDRDRIDAIGSSVDWCHDEQECQFAAAAPDGGWVGLVLRPDAGSSLLDTAAIRERWTPVLADAASAAATVRGALQPASDTAVACDELLSVDEARELLGDPEAFVSDPRGWGEGGTFVTEKWHVAFNASGCTWASGPEADNVTVYALRAPEWARTAAFENVVATSEQHAGEHIEIAGVDDAWMYRYTGGDDVSGIAGTYDLLIGDVWLQLVTTDGDDLDEVVSRIVANLAD